MLTGLAYPLVVTGLAQVFFPGRANGSLLERDGKVLGSELVGQTFSTAGYFWTRPSATAYNGGASSGSTLGPTNPALSDRVARTVEPLRATHGEAAGGIPVDLATASGSGLDPHISPAAALYQVPRIARARGLPEEAVLGLVRAHIEGRQLGFLGEPRVNVLRLNLALDELARPKAGRVPRSESNQGSLADAPALRRRAKPEGRGAEAP